MMSFIESAVLQYKSGIEPVNRIVNGTVTEVYIE